MTHWGHGILQRQSMAMRGPVSVSNGLANPEGMRLKPEGDWRWPQKITENFLQNSTLLVSHYVIK